MYTCVHDRSTHDWWWTSKLTSPRPVRRYSSIHLPVFFVSVSFCHLSSRMRTARWAALRCTSVRNGFTANWAAHRTVASWLRTCCEPIVVSVMARSLCERAMHSLATTVSRSGQQQTMFLSFLNTNHLLEVTIRLRLSHLTFLYGKILQVL